jgi:hypothetical protein
VSITENELLSFLKTKFKSVYSCKIIFDTYNNISKGFGFADLTNIDEFNSILRNKEKLVLKNKQLIIK